MRVNPAIHSKFPMASPVSYPDWARLTRWMVDIFVEKRARPMMGHVRDLSARK